MRWKLWQVFMMIVSLIAGFLFGLLGGCGDDLVPADAPAPDAAQLDPQACCSLLPDEPGARECIAANIQPLDCVRVACPRPGSVPLLLYVCRP